MDDVGICRVRYGTRTLHYGPLGIAVRQPACYLAGSIRKAGTRAVSQISKVIANLGSRFVLVP